MAKLDKLIVRFKSKPKDFTWDELVTLLNKLGFNEMQGRGSRVKFYNKKLDCLIQLHKPHPEKILKRYVINEILYVLISEQLI